MTDTLLNEFMSPEHRVFGHYDEVGWWKLLQLAQLRHARRAVRFHRPVTGLLYWNAREEAIACLCSIVAGVGLSPLFFP